MPSERFLEQATKITPSDTSMRLLDEHEKPHDVKQSARECYLKALQRKFDADDPQRMFAEAMADKWWPMA